jgi:hypothetical protein
VVTYQLAHKKPVPVEEKALKAKARVIMVIKGMTVKNSEL